MLSWASGVANLDPPFDLSPNGLVTARHPGFGTVNVTVPGTSTFGTGCVVIIGAATPVGPTPTGLRILGLPSTLTISPTGVAQSAVITAQVLDANGAVIPGNYPYQWTSGNPSVLLTAATGANATITAAAGGIASVTLGVVLSGVNLGLSALVSVVDQRPPPPGPGVISIIASSPNVLLPNQTVDLTAVVGGAQPNPNDIIWDSTSPQWLAIVGPSTGRTITVRNTGTIPRAASVQINAHVTANAQPSSGSIAVPLSP